MIRLAVLLCSLVLSAAVHAQAPKGAESAAHKANGTVTKVDRAKSRVTIKHEAVPTLQWPAMTMAFAVKDKALLEKLEPGRQVQFQFAQQGKDYVITEVK